MKQLRFTRKIFSISLIVFCNYGLAQDRLTGKPFATRSVVITQHTMACTSHPLATAAALDVLRKGGNAIDAAIAANAVLGVVEPEMNGIGGDLFAMVYDAKSSRLFGLNSSGRSPGHLTLAEFKSRGLTSIPQTGPLAVSAPGCVDGWYELHNRFGHLPMSEILSYAINYAKDGFPLADEAAYYWAKTGEATGLDHNFTSLYLPDGHAPRRGEIFKNPQLANTLEKIAIYGRDYFYKGEIAKVIDGFMKQNGGFLSSEDLGEQKATWVEPLSTNYRGYDVWELPPNSQGIAVLQMLNILEGFDFSKIPFGSAQHIHLFVEAKRLAYEDRAKYYADMDFAKVPVARLISKKYADARRFLIDSVRASANLSSGDSLLDGGETVYLTIADNDGNMISLIQSNFSVFGSRMVPDNLGFVLQNRGRLFTLSEGFNNTYAPHKRPFHTIIPAFVTRNGKPFMSFGVMGGGFQPLGQVEVLMNMIDFGMNEQEAGDAPRIDHHGSSEPTGEQGHGAGTIFLESGFSEETIRGLIDMGYQVGFQEPGNYGGYQCIRVDTQRKVYFGASDPRKDGMAAGY